MHDTRSELVVVELARSYGYHLTQRELGDGQLAWEWQADDDDASPQFLTRGQAFAYMSNKIARLRGASRPTHARAHEA